IAGVADAHKEHVGAHRGLVRFSQGPGDTKIGRPVRRVDLNHGRAAALNSIILPSGSAQYACGQSVLFSGRATTSTPSARSRSTAALKSVTLNAKWASRVSIPSGCGAFSG